MTCDDARERFSELTDNRLTAAERGAVDAHLTGCAACRQELERFRATVALVRSLEPARAPAGFVNRVTAAARPRPWWRRAAAGAFFPLPVKLPLEAAAVLLIGVGVAYLFQRTPELQHAAREAPAVVTQERRAPETPLASEREAPAEAPEAKPDAPRQLADAPAPPPAAMEQRGAVAHAPQSPPVTVPPPAEPQAKDDKAENVAGARASSDAAAPQRSRDEAKEQLSRRDAPRLAAKAARVADVTATLHVASRPEAASAVRDLVARHRGTIESTRADADATVVEARIPRDEYAAFAAGLAAVGRPEPAAEADLPAEVRVTIRLR